MPRGKRVRMLKTLTHTFIDRFGDMKKVCFLEGEVHNFPPAFAARLIKRGFACLPA